MRRHVTLVVGEARRAGSTPSTVSRRRAASTPSAGHSARLVVVNTHHNSTKAWQRVIDAPADAIWAHERAAAILRDRARTCKRSWWEEFRDEAPASRRDDRIHDPPCPTTWCTASRRDDRRRAIAMRHLGRGGAQPRAISSSTCPTRPVIAAT